MAQLIICCFVVTWILGSLAVLVVIDEVDKKIIKYTGRK